MILNLFNQKNTTCLVDVESLDENRSILSEETIKNEEIIHGFFSSPLLTIALTRQDETEMSRRATTPMNMAVSYAFHFRLFIFRLHISPTFILTLNFNLFFNE